MTMQIKGMGLDLELPGKRLVTHPRGSGRYLVSSNRSRTAKAVRNFQSRLILTATISQPSGFRFLGKSTSPPYISRPVGRPTAYGPLIRLPPQACKEVLRLQS